MRTTQQPASSLRQEFVLDDMQQLQVGDHRLRVGEGGMSGLAAQGGGEVLLGVEPELGDAADLALGHHEAAEERRPVGCDVWSTSR